MANKPKIQERDRRATVEAMRKAQAAQERRKSMIFFAVAVVVGIALVAAVAVPSYLKKRNDPANKDLSAFGVAAAAADCQSAKTTPGTNIQGLRTHVADGTKEKYKTVPPSYGPHWAQPAYPARAFYTKRDRPRMEQLVHNLEHGYTVLWYDATVKGAELSTLKDVAASGQSDKAVGGGKKFIVSAWDDAYGKLPAGMHVGISHWGTKSSVTQVCGKVSGAAVKKFINAHPSTDAPEPNAA